MGKAAKPNFKKLGRLTSLGVQEPWQVPLYIPESYEDLSQPLEDANGLDCEPRPIWFEIAGTPKGYYNGAPRLVIPVRDASGESHAMTIFGDTKLWMESLAGVERACFVATGGDYRGRLSITATEMVEEEWVGRIRPKYAGKKQVITPQLARKLVQANLKEGMPEAVAFIARELGAPVSLQEVLRQVGAAGWTLEQLLVQAHLPHSMRHAEHAQRVLRRIAAIGQLQAMHGAKEASTVSNPIALTTVEKRIRELPIKALTSDQRNAIDTLAREMGQGAPLNALLLGEVGTGKTAVASVIAAATMDARPGECVIILCPNTLLAEQFHREINSYYCQDFAIRLVTGDTAAKADLDADILVGTSALIFREIARTVALVVCDEQHRWSRSQREHHVAPGTHLLEMSATPIPRSLALVRYGKSTVLFMRETHAQKTINTLLCESREQQQRMYRKLDANLQRGDIALVVYPKRDVSGKDDKDLLGDRAEADAPAPKGGIDDRHSVALAFQRWNQRYPGKVATLTSDDEAETKVRVLRDLGDRKVQICLSTTVIEVGITISGLFLLVIVCPERLGLMQLHQIRGRLARHGGTGHCLLFCPEPINDKQRQRLEHFCSTNDGFALAEYDMFDRGIGDLSRGSDKQTGADETFLYGVKMDARMLDEVAPLVSRWREMAAQAA